MEGDLSRAKSRDGEASWAAAPRRRGSSRRVPILDAAPPAVCLLAEATSDAVHMEDSRRLEPRHLLCVLPCSVNPFTKKIDATSRAPSVFSVHNVGVQDPGYQVIDGYIWGLLSRNYLQRTVNLSAPHMMDIRLQVKRLKCLEVANHNRNSIAACMQARCLLMHAASW
ncbi:unnamed protein product [Urochloa humidicola]